MSYIALALLPEDKDPDVYVVPVRWLSMASAIATMYRATLQWMHGWTTLDYMASTAGPDFRDDNQVYDFAYEEPFRRLLNFDDDADIMDTEAYTAYDKTLAYIAKTYSSYRDDHEDAGRFCRRVFALGPMSGDGFVSYVGQEKPRALAILAHHCAMMKALDETWYFRGVAERELNGIAKKLPKKWQWAMEWPFKIYNSIKPMQCSWGMDGEAEMANEQESAKQQVPLQRD